MEKECSVEGSRGSFSGESRSGLAAGPEHGHALKGNTYINCFT